MAERAGFLLAVFCPPREKGDMDLWDVAKVMWRRRWVAVPLLLLTIVAAVFALLTVPPDYHVNGQIAVTPPSAVSNDLTKQEVTSVNPYSVNTLAELIGIMGNRPEVHSQLKSEGLSPEYEITVKTFGLTTIDIDVLAKSQEMAVKTLGRIIELVQLEFQQRQASFNLPPNGTITTEVLSAGEEVKIERTVGKRTLIVIVGVGLLVTVAVSLWVDALVRRRYLRVPESPEARAVVPVSPAVSLPPPVSFTPSALGSSAKPSPSEHETVPVPDTAADNDSTVILPLAGVSWASSGGKSAKGKRNSGNGKDR
jgi:capsular polysaccharide biosynthesis protein